MYDVSTGITNIIIMVNTIWSACRCSSFIALPVFPLSSEASRFQKGGLPVP